MTTDRAALLAHLRDHHDGSRQTIPYGDHNHVHSHALVISDEELARLDDDGQALWDDAALARLHDELEGVSTCRP